LRSPQAKAAAKAPKTPAALKESNGPRGAASVSAAGGKMKPAASRTDSGAGGRRPPAAAKKVGGTAPGSCTTVRHRGRVGTAWLARGLTQRESGRVTRGRHVEEERQPGFVWGVWVRPIPISEGGGYMSFAFDL
jgi:hypothetical protein